MAAMPTTDRAALDGQRGLGALLRELADGGARLVRQEVRLARLETVEVTRTVGMATVWACAGGALLLLGVLAACTGLILLGGDQWLRDRFWLAALIVVVLAGGAALWLAGRARRWLTPDRFAPDQTLETLKEDREWLRRQLTSGATSSSRAPA
jgi:hypothetical protein